MQAVHLQGSTRYTAHVQPAGTSISQAATSAISVRSRPAPLMHTSTCQSHEAVLTRLAHSIE